MYYAIWFVVGAIIGFVVGFFVGGKHKERLMEAAGTLKDMVGKR